MACQGWLSRYPYSVPVSARVSVLFSWDKGCPSGIRTVDYTIASHNYISSWVGTRTIAVPLIAAMGRLQAVHRALYYQYYCATLTAGYMCIVR